MTANNRASLDAVVAFSLISEAIGAAPVSPNVGPSCRTMEQTETSQTGFAWRIACAAIAPFLVESGYLLLSRWPSYRFTTFSDYAGFVVSILAGAAFLATLPIRPLQRILSLLLYIPVLATGLFFYDFWFVAVVFHDGL